MMLLRVFGFELRKIVMRKPVLVALLAAVAIVFGTFMQYSQWDGKWLGSYEKFQQWKGPYTQAKDDKIQRLAMDDYRLHGHSDPTFGALSQVSGNVSIYNQALSMATERLHQEVKGDYSHQADLFEQQRLRQIGPPSYQYVGMWEYIFRFMEYQGYLIVGGLLLLGIPSIFASEFSNNVFQMLRSTREGRRKIFMAKVLAATTYAVGVGGGMVVLNILPNVIVYGAHGWNAALNNLRAYGETPMNLTVGQSVALQFGLCTLGCIAFTILISLVSLVTKSNLLTLFIAGCVFFVPTYVYSTIGLSTHWVDILCKFSYTQMMQVAPIIRQFDVMDWFGRPVLPLNYIVMAQIILSISFLFIMYRRYMRTEAVTL